eukprot:TRINITY_DN8676_c0_g4_i1.p1 TRINITY_DN8676_c0_g4~~TRINITY_DN8676_c0_g4_i1.p1  ORF type:complete len:648 (+),score=116.95 TRINITY_DN8676_c0_g4_i1:38-1981(+)
MDGFLSVWQRIIQRPDIPDDEKALIGPLDKFTKYGRIPCKLIFNLLIVTFLTAEVIFFVPIDNKYHNDSVLALADKFTPEGQSSFEPELKYHFYDTQEITNFLLESFDAWDSLTQDPTALFIHPTGSSGERLMPFVRTVMKVNGTFKDLIINSKVGFDTYTFDCILTRDNKLGPFNGTEEVSFDKNRDKKDLHVFADRIQAPSPVKASRLSKAEVRRKRSRIKNDSNKNANNDIVAPRRRFRSKPKASTYFSNDEVPLHADPKCDGVSDIFDKIKSFTVRYPVSSIRINGPTNEPSKRRWDLAAEYDMSTRTGVIEYELKYTPGILGRIVPSSRIMGSSYLALSLVVIILSSWDLILRLKALRGDILRKKREKLLRSTKNAGNLARARSSEKQELAEKGGGNGAESPILQLNDEDLLTLGDDIASSTSSATELDEAKAYGVEQEVAEGAGLDVNFSGSKIQWLLIAIISDVLILISKTLTLVVCTTTSDVSSGTLTANTTLSGFAVLGAYIVIISHLEHQPRFYLLIKTLKRGTPRAFKFVVGSFPILMGYALLGTVLFGGYSEKFATLDGAFVTLFALMNGDIIDDTFQSIFFESNVVLQIVSRIYLYTYIALFIYAILNILLAIMEDAYFQVKRQIIQGLHEAEG